MGTPRRCRARGASRPSKLPVSARGRWWYQGANGPRRTRKTRGICHTGSLQSNPGTRPRGRNPIAGPAERFSPTRIYPECSARKPRHTRPVHLGGALRIDSLSFGLLGAQSCHGEALEKTSGMTHRLTKMWTMMNPPFRVRTAAGKSMKSLSAAPTASSIFLRKMLLRVGNPGG
jgi:hypothetical protein